MLLLKNKKATFNYEILEKFVVGVSLLGTEVKSLKNKKGSFEGSFVTISSPKKNPNKNDIFLKNFFIPPYQEKNTPESYDSYRERRLLFKKREIIAIKKKMKSQRLTIVPISFSLKNQLIKLEVALVRGKKKYDKREDIKKKDDKRNAEREVKAKLR